MVNKTEIFDLYKSLTPFYRQKLEFINKYEDAPFTTKNELIQSQINQPPYGNFIDSSKPVYQIYRTSGTTSHPLLLSFTKTDIDYITDSGAQNFKYCGMGDFGNDEVVINCLNLSMWAGGFFDSQSMMKTGVQVINFGTGNTIELIKLVYMFNNKYKTSIHCTPSYLPIIEERLKSDFQSEASGLKIHALYLGAEGGVQNNDYRNDLISKWQCKVYNANYGMSEVCSIMASASDENILKFSESLLCNYYFEMIDGDGNIKDQYTINEGDEGVLVFTSLIKESQPLFRYLTNERIKIIKIHNREIFFEVLGRSDDMIVYKGINFYPEQLRCIIVQFKELTGLYKIQVKKNNGIVEDINLLCEIKKDIHFNEDQLRSAITFRIRNEFTLKLQVNFVYRFDIEGNKHKMVEYI